MKMVRHFNDSSKEFAAESIMSAVNLISRNNGIASDTIRPASKCRLLQGNLEKVCSLLYQWQCRFRLGILGIGNYKKKRTYNTLKACACIKI